MDNELVLVRTTSNIREAKKELKTLQMNPGLVALAICKYVIVVDKKRGKKNAKKQIN